VIGDRCKLYLAAILDLFSRFIVGWAVSAVNDRHGDDAPPLPDDHWGCSVASAPPRLTTTGTPPSTHHVLRSM